MHALNSWILTRTSKTAKFYGHVPFQAISFSTSTLCYVLNFKFANYACWMTFFGTHLSWWQPTSGKWICTPPWVNTNHISPELSGSGVDSSLPTVSSLGITPPCLTHLTFIRDLTKTSFSSQTALWTTSIVHGNVFCVFFCEFWSNVLILFWYILGQIPILHCKPHSSPHESQNSWHLLGLEELSC